MITTQLTTIIKLLCEYINKLSWNSSSGILNVSALYIFKSKKKHINSKVPTIFSSSNWKNQYSQLFYSDPLVSNVIDTYWLIQFLMTFLLNTQKPAIIRCYDIIYANVRRNSFRKVISMSNFNVGHWITCSIILFTFSLIDFHHGSDVYHPPPKNIFKITPSEIWWPIFSPQF